MMKLITILTLIISLASCSKKMLPPKETTVVIKDSIIERERIVYRDTVITLPGDTTEISFAIPCPEVVVDQKASNGRMKLTVKSDGKGNVKVNCNSDSLILVIKGLETIIKEKEKYNSNKTTIKIPYPVEVIKTKRPKSWWWLLLIFIGETFWIFRKPIIGLVKKIFGIWV